MTITQFALYFVITLLLIFLFLVFLLFAIPMVQTIIQMIWKPKPKTGAEKVAAFLTALSTMSQKSENGDPLCNSQTNENNSLEK